MRVHGGEENEGEKGIQGWEGLFQSCFDSSKNIWSNEEHFSLLQALILYLK